MPNCDGKYVPVIGCEWSEGDSPGRSVLPSPPGGNWGRAFYQGTDRHRACLPRSIGAAKLDTMIKGCLQQLREIRF